MNYKTQSNNEKNCVNVVAAAFEQMLIYAP